MIVYVNMWKVHVWKSSDRNGHKNVGREREREKRFLNWIQTFATIRKSIRSHFQMFEWLTTDTVILLNAFKFIIIFSFFHFEIFGILHLHWCEQRVNKNTKMSAAQWNILNICQAKEIPSGSNAKWEVSEKKKVGETKQNQMAYHNKYHLLHIRT